VNRLDAFIAILDVLKELPEKDAAELISLLFTLNGTSMRFLLKGDPGAPKTEES